MRATDLAYSQALGIRDAPSGAEHLLELPGSPTVQNHLGTIHAAAQFSLAEAASAECLQRHFGAQLRDAIGAVRSAEVRYRRPATGRLRAFAEPDADTRTELIDNVQRRGRSGAVILVDLRDDAGTLTFHARFEWFISHRPNTAP